MKRLFEIPLTAAQRQQRYLAQHPEMKLKNRLRQRERRKQAKITAKINESVIAKAMFGNFPNTEFLPQLLTPEQQAEDDQVKLLMERIINKCP